MDFVYDSVTYEKFINDNTKLGRECVQIHSRFAMRCLLFTQKFKSRWIL